MTDFLSPGRAALTFSAVALAVIAMPTAAQADDVCKQVDYNHAGYVVCDFAHPADLGLHWTGADGQPYRTFSALADAEDAEGRELVFALNAGMYDTDYRPMGLYAESGKEKTRLNTKSVGSESGPVPNFYKSPNGVFYVGPEGQAAVVTTDAFSSAAPQTRIATQSGPLLVMDGELNPILIPGSTDRNRRSAVGVCDNGMVRLAISDTRVNFYDLAQLFREHLACPDVLYLDGGRGTGIYLPEMNRNDISWHGGFGPMFSYSVPKP